MAKNRGQYRLTAARREALRKAQLASARKRRKANFVRGVRYAGVLAGGIAVTAIQANANHYLSNPSIAIKDYRHLKGHFKGYIAKRRGKGDPNAPKMPARKPIGYHKTSAKAIRHVAGRRVASRSRLR